MMTGCLKYKVATRFEIYFFFDVTWIFCVLNVVDFKPRSCEACIGYFGIRDIGLFFRDTGIFVFFILGYGILDFILGYELN